MSRRHSLQLVLQFSNDSFSNSQALMSLFRGRWCVQAKSSATMKVCDVFARDLEPTHKGQKNHKSAHTDKTE